MEAWCERDDAAASDGRGVNCASFSSVAAAEAKPDAWRCSCIRSKSSLKWRRGQKWVIIESYNYCIKIS